MKNPNPFLLQLLIALCAGYLLLIYACGNPTTQSAAPIQQYIHIAHCRMDSNTEFVKGLKEKDFSQYAGLLLGGDLAKNTSINKRTMESYDSIFSFGESRTLWALGNHDYDNVSLVKQFTKRPTYYAFANEGIQFLVLDTQDSLSHMVGGQLALIEQTIDRLASRSENQDRFPKYLILLHHKLFWMPDHPKLKKELGKTANAQLGDCFYCTNSNNFYSTVYPLLRKAKEKGIEVLCIGGDLGYHRKSFEYKTKDGIHFLASGFNYNDVDNEVLILSYDPNVGQLNWHFELFNKLE